MDPWDNVKFLWYCLTCDWPTRIWTLVMVAIAIIILIGII